MVIFVATITTIGTVLIIPVITFMNIAIWAVPTKFLFAFPNFFIPLLFTPHNQ